MKVKALLYCTKARHNLLREYENKTIFIGCTSRSDCHNYDSEYGMNSQYERECCECLNGKIVAECDIETEEIKLGKYIEYEGWSYEWTYEFETGTLDKYDLESKSCLSKEQMEDYLINEKGYALHISNLKVFDKPLELERCIRLTLYSNYATMSHVHKAPQNMMEVAFIGESYVLISIRPKWLCKILNGKKTIEVRKQVLKCMKEVENEKCIK